MGALLVLSGVTLAHRLGAATFAACIIVGQLTASVIVDHFGWVGFQQHSISFSLCRLAWTRIEKRSPASLEP